jgi:hypothetical protein
MLWLLMLFIIVSSIIFQSWRIEHFSPDPEFVNKTYMNNVIDKSNFFNNMSPLDLIARNVDSSVEYKSIYRNNIFDFTTSERKRLTEITSSIGHLQYIPWKFIKVSDKIENGYPHTLQDVIILPASFFNKDNENIKITLLHEKIHVYQRLYPKETLTLLTRLGFNKVDIINIPESISNMRRNNPDILGTFEYNNIIPLQVYKSDRPTSLADSKTILYEFKKNIFVDDDGHFIPYYINQKEHPYEIMAVLIPKILLGEQHKDEMFQTAIQWCQEYIIK